MRRLLALTLLVLGSGAMFAALPLDTPHGAALSTAAAAGEADLAILDYYVACLDLNGNTACDPDEPAPLEIPVSEDVTIITKKLIHNNGPDDVDAETTGTATASPDCEILDPVHVEQIRPVPVSVNLTIKEAFTIHCLQPSEHTFNFDNLIAPKDPLVIDPDPDNNTAHVEWTVAAVGQADLEIVDQRTVVWLTNVDVSENVVVTLETDVRNNGTYGPVEAQFEGWLQPATHCTVQPSVISQQVELAADETKTIQQEFTIHCDEHCLRTFIFYNRVTAKAPHIPDPQPENNERSRFLPSIHVWVKADVKIVSQRVTNPPTDIGVSQDVVVTLEKVLHNNGPYAEDVTVEILRTASPPPDCTVTPSDPVGEEVTLPHSVTVVRSEDYIIHCSAESSHTFSFDNEVEIDTLHVRDPDLGNNQAHTELPVAVWTQADVRISGQQLVSPPTEIDVSEDVEVTLRKTLHNTGGYGPVDVSISASASAPPDCTATPDPANPTSVNLPDSTEVVVDEVWSIHCDQPSEHSFSFDNTIAITTPHVEDPLPLNNTASTGLTLTARAQADVRITGQQLVDPPTEIDVSEDVEVTLRKTLHNNGGYGPVDISISATATAPPGCSATPDPANPTSANLPISTEVVVDEVWSIHCDEPSEHTFSFDNSIAITTLHVEDPLPLNNTASTELVVTVARPCGDVDCDGDVDAVDALFITQYVVALKLPSDQCPPPEGHIYLPAGDVDCDGDVDAVDALFVLQHVVGQRPDLCVCPGP